MIAAIMELARGEMRDYAQRNMRAAMFAVLAVVLAVGAVGYGLSALSVWLASIHGAVVAHLIIGGGLLITALAAGAAAVVARRPARRPPAAGNPADLLDASAAIEAAKSLAPSLGTVLPVVLIVGIVAGRFLTSRK